ncbi:hypothetical protein BC941DRAFT_465941 [Chlamydoabsidia padenii]|nr:hypothetical protein BC941DRAFT_475364 [Chlamydoabsidia padenii]KAI8342271.1 hypothetical protein BC941DRAFT_465941 [Chlamydoabsidia padenii]
MASTVLKYIIWLARSLSSVPLLFGSLIPSSQLWFFNVGIAHWMTGLTRRSLLLLATTIGSTNYSCLLDDGTLIYGSLIRITLTAWLSANESYDGYETCFVSIIGIARIVWFIYFGLFGLLTRITYLVYFLGLRTRIIWFTYVVYLDTLHGLLDYFGLLFGLLDLDRSVGSRRRHGRFQV